MKKILSVFFTLTMIFSLQARSNYESYYNGVEGKKQKELKTELHRIIGNPNVPSYNGLYSVYKTSDNKNGKVWDIYSNCNFSFGRTCGSYKNVCDCFNREHMIPQSWFDKRSPMVSDAHQVYPTDGKVNGIRSNYPHGETNARPIGGGALGKFGKCNVPGYSDYVYEPDDQYKGDVARVYFYFVTCYENRLSSFNGKVLTKAPYPGLTNWFLKLMLKWHRQDPVSQKEIDRNNAVYSKQHNRNPFVDYPEMVEYIWGDKQNIAFSFDPNTAVDQTEMIEMKVYSMGETLYIENCNDVYEIYNTTGQQIYKGTENQVHLGHGIFILKSGKTTIKIAQ